MGSGVKCRVEEINLNREGQSKADRVVLRVGPIRGILNDMRFEDRHKLGVLLYEWGKRLKEEDNPNMIDEFRDLLEHVICIADNNTVWHVDGALEPYALALRNIRALLPAIRRGKFEYQQEELADIITQFTLAAGIKSSLLRGPVDEGFTKCRACQGEGWLWGHELCQPPEECGDTRYPCDQCHGIGYR